MEKLEMKAMRIYCSILIVALGFCFTNCTNTIEEQPTNSMSEYKMQKLLESEEYIALQKGIQSFGIHIKKQFSTLTSQEQDKLLKLLNTFKNDKIDDNQKKEIQEEINELLNVDFAKEVSHLETLGSNVNLYAQKNDLSHKEIVIASHKNVTFPRIRSNSENGDTASCVSVCSTICAACLAAIGTPSGGAGAAFCITAYAACLLTC